MKKVAILTITEGQNYGNRLQNYALQEIIRELGFDVDTIRIKTQKDRSIFLIVVECVKNCIKTITGKGRTTKGRVQREIRFRRFNREKICFSRFVIGNGREYNSLSDKYDYFVCGSDQVWNANFLHVRQNLGEHVASFAEGDKRIAYAASFGADEIVKEYADLFKKEIGKFKAISVREESGNIIVKEIVGRDDSHLVLDPTMMLSCERWRMFERKPRRIYIRPFILVYMLRSIDDSTRKYINEIKNTYNADVVYLDIEGKIDEIIMDINNYSNTPEEFVWLVDHSECVLTDSFHATVFSIIFNKPFLVFDRGLVEGSRMNSRIQTLLSLFSLERFKVVDKGKVIYPDDYDKGTIKRVLTDKQKESLAFLKNALDCG